MNKPTPNELSAMRAQAYPQVLTDDGREWYLEALDKRNDEIAALQSENQRLREALERIANDDTVSSAQSAPYNNPRAIAKSALAHPSQGKPAKESV